MTGLQGPAQPGADSLRAVLDSVFANPAYRWEQRPNPLAFLVRAWERAQLWMAGLEARRPELYWLLFWALIAVLVAIFVHGVWLMGRTLRAAGGPAGVALRAPGPEIRGAGWYRREAARLAREGRYPEAMQADFLALVLELDQRRLVRFQASKTPLEYTDEAGLSEPARRDLRDLVRSLYGYVFARRDCGPDQFAEWHARTAPDRYAPAH